MSTRSATPLQRLLAAFLSAACLAFVPAVATAKIVSPTDATPAAWSLPAAADLPDNTAAETENFLVEDADGNLYLAVYVGKNPYNGGDVYALSPKGLAIEVNGKTIVKDDPTYTGLAANDFYANALDQMISSPVTIKFKTSADLAENLRNRENEWQFMVDRCQELKRDLLEKMREWEEDKRAAKEKFASEHPKLSKITDFIDYVSESNVGPCGMANCAGGLARMAKGLPRAAEKTMLGKKGTQVTSKTLWKKQGARIDVENPAPGKRPGQLHYQDQAGNKYLYDPETGTFKNAPKSVNAMLEEDASFRKAVDKGMKQYLGEDK